MVLIAAINVMIKLQSYHCGLVKLQTQVFTSTMNDLTISQAVYPELKTTCRLNYSGTNFHIWKIKLDLVLRENEVLYVLTEPKPSKDNPDDVASHDEWVDDDFKARHIILGTLDDNFYLTYHQHETAKAMMDALTRFFTRPSMGKRLMLFRRYLNHRMKEGMSINQHILEMNRMAKDLELQGLRLPEDVHAGVLMESLPKSWEDLVSSINMNLARDEEALGLDNVRQKLLDAGVWKELRRARNDEESHSRVSSRGGFKGKCNNCGEFGHGKSDCLN